MKKNLINILNFKQFKIVLLLEGLLVGIISGLVIVGYRIYLSNGASLLQQVLSFCKQSFLTIILWFIVLIINCFYYFKISR